MKLSTNLLFFILIVMTSYTCIRCFAYQLIEMETCGCTYRRAIHYYYISNARKELTPRSTDVCNFIYFPCVVRRTTSRVLRSAYSGSSPGDFVFLRNIHPLWFSWNLFTTAVASAFNCLRRNLHTIVSNTCDNAYVSCFLRHHAFYCTGRDIEFLVFHKDFNTEISFFDNIVNKKK